MESFHGDNLGDALKGLTVEDEEKQRMTAILAKYAREDVNDGGNGFENDEEEEEDDEEDDEDEDGGGGGGGGGGRDGNDAGVGMCELSEAVLEKLARGEELTPEDLTPAERAAFERAAASGELSHMVQPWTAWWTLPAARDIALARDGSRMIAVVALGGYEEEGGSSSFAVVTHVGPPMDAEAAVEGAAEGAAEGAVPPPPVGLYKFANLDPPIALQAAWFRFQPLSLSH